MDNEPQKVLFTLNVGTVFEGKGPYIGTFQPSESRSDLMPAKIILDVIGPEPKIVDDAGKAWIADVACRLPDIAKAARHEVTDQFLELYNDGWRQPEDPEMSAQTFAQALGAASVTLIWTPSEAAKSVEVWFQNVPMYFGHSLYSFYKDDGELTNIDCGMFG